MISTTLINTGDYCSICGDPIYRCADCNITCCTRCDGASSGCPEHARYAPDDEDEEAD